MSDKTYPSAPAGEYPSEPPPPYPASDQPHFYPPNQNQSYGANFTGPPPFPQMTGPPPAGQNYIPPTTHYYPPPTSNPTTTTTVIMGGPTFGFGSHPINTQCPHCHSQILTETRAEPGVLAWLICLACICFGLWFGCCLIPFCVDDLQDIQHRCPQCKHLLGSHRRL